jgi:hypothetical protein
MLVDDGHGQRYIDSLTDVKPLRGLTGVTAGGVQSFNP